MRKLLFLLTAFTLILSCSSDETSTPVTPPAPIVKYTITLSAGEGGTVSTPGGTTNRKYQLLDLQLVEVFFNIKQPLGYYIGYYIG